MLYRRDSRFGWPYRLCAYLRKEKLERLEPIDYRDMTLNLLFFAFDSYYIFYNNYTFHFPSLKSKTEVMNNIHTETNSLSIWKFKVFNWILGS